MDQKYKVLFVEDEDDLRKGILTILAKLLPEIIFLEAGNGLEAIKVLSNEKNSIDLIITDLFLPKITGYELAKFIKSNNLEITLVAYTGEEISDEKLFNTGFSKILRKKSNFHDILDELHRIIISFKETNRILAQQNNR